MVDDTYAAYDYTNLTPGFLVGSARTKHIQCIYVISGREITKYTVIHGVHIRFWPTLFLSHAHLCKVALHTSPPRHLVLCFSSSCYCSDIQALAWATPRLIRSVCGFASKSSSSCYCSGIQTLAWAKPRLIRSVCSCASKSSSSCYCSGIQALAWAKPRLIRSVCGCACKLSC